MRAQANDYLLPHTPTVDDAEKRRRRTEQCKRTTTKREKKKRILSNKTKRMELESSHETLTQNVISFIRSFRFACRIVFRPPTSSTTAVAKLVMLYRLSRSLSRSLYLLYLNKQNLFDRKSLCFGQKCVRQKRAQ